MGNSFATFRDKHVNARDYKFEVWLFLLGRMISEINDAPAWLRETGAAWFELARSPPNGCMDPELEKHLDTPEKVARFASLCDDGLERLSCFGAAVPAGFLNELCEARGDEGFQKDLDTAMLLEFGRALKRLVNGEQADRVVTA